MVPKVLIGNMVSEANSQGHMGVVRNSNTWPRGFRKSLGNRPCQLSVLSMGGLEIISMVSWGIIHGMVQMDSHIMSMAV